MIQLSFLYLTTENCLLEFRFPIIYSIINNEKIFSWRKLIFQKISNVDSRLNFISLAVYTLLTSDLEIELSSNIFQNFLVLGKLGKSNVYGSTDGCTQVGGAEGQEAQAVIAREWKLALNGVNSLGNKTIWLFFLSWKYERKYF